MEIDIGYSAIEVPSTWDKIKENKETQFLKYYVQSIISLKIFFFLFVVNFVIHWNKTAMGLHVFPIPIPPPTSLSTRSP